MCRALKGRNKTSSSRNVMDDLCDLDTFYCALSGLVVGRGTGTQGVALGCRVAALQAAMRATRWPRASLNTEGVAGILPANWHESTVAPEINLGAYPSPHRLTAALRSAHSPPPDSPDSSCAGGRPV